MPGEPMINFSAHVYRAGEAGAPADFEQMLGLLVSAVENDQARLVFANPGDWGIDVLVGELDGQASVWQAKYFSRGVSQSQIRQIESSFGRVVRQAAAEGFRLARWVLCVPCSLDAPATRWWQTWVRECQREHDTEIELWDENRLRELLLLPEATHIRRAFYNPFRDLRPSPAPLGPSRMLHTAAGSTWR